MSKVYFVIFCLFAVAGCADKTAEENAKKAALYDGLQASVAKQQKLEECMSKAASDSRDFRKHEMLKLGCEKYEKDGFGPADVINSCNAVIDFSKRDQLEAEERCVKLYK